MDITETPTTTADANDTTSTTTDSGSGALTSLEEGKIANTLTGEPATAEEQVVVVDGPTPEDVAKAATEQAKLEARTKRREELANIARIKAAEREARAASFRERQMAQRLEMQRREDMERARQADEWERIKQTRDPNLALQALRSIGLPSRALAEHVIEENSPEHLFAQREAAIRQEMDKRIQEIERRQLLREQQSVIAQATQSFVSDVLNNADKYPALTSLYTPQEIAAEARALAELGTREGYEYDDQELAEVLEMKVKPRYNKLREKLLASTSPSSVASKSATKSPAITSNGASGGAVHSLPKDFEKLPPAEQDDILLRLYNTIAASDPRR